MADETQKLTDPSVIRALAHPARLAILEYLGGQESATATECAEVVGLSPSATSYHLRELARHEMVDEAPGTDRRERRWRSTGDFSTDEGRPDDDATRAATRLLGRLVLDRGDQRAQQYLAHSKDEPEDWWSAATLSETRLRMTVEELRALAAAFAELTRPYTRRARSVPDGSREVQVTFRAFPVDL